MEKLIIYFLTSLMYQNLFLQLLFSINSRFFLKLLKLLGLNYLNHNLKVMIIVIIIMMSIMTELESDKYLRKVYMNETIVVINFDELNAPSIQKTL